MMNYLSKARSRWMIKYLSTNSRRWMMNYLSMTRSRWMANYLSRTRGRWMINYLSMTRSWWILNYLSRPWAGGWWTTWAWPGSGGWWTVSKHSQRQVYDELPEHIAMGRYVISYLSLSMNVDYILPEHVQEQVYDGHGDGPPLCTRFDTPTFLHIVNCYHGSPTEWLSSKQLRLNDGMINGWKITVMDWITNYRTIHGND